MARTYNELYLYMRRVLKDSGVEDFALEARRLLAQAAGGQGKGGLPSG